MNLVIHFVSFYINEKLTISRLSNLPPIVDLIFFSQVHYTEEQMAGETFHNYP